MKDANSSSILFVVFGNQLFDPKHLPLPGTVNVYMAEDHGLCTYVRHHQQKLVLFLAAMREYADELRELGYSVVYRHLDMNTELNYEQQLALCVEELGITEVRHFEIEDKPMEKRLIDFSVQNNLKRVEIRSPMFLSSRKSFKQFASGKSRLLMGDFYKLQRKRLQILIDDTDQPVGGKWSFDEDNRKKLPKDKFPKPLQWSEPTSHVKDVISLVEKYFAHHPGQACDYRWPTTRQQARVWLDEFINERLHEFGPYEDAMSTRSSSVFHSALTPCLNLGLLTPDEIVNRVLECREDIPLQSVEGFIRQVIGWREFVRGIYQLKSEQQERGNFWGHSRKMTDVWYSGETGILPLDDSIQTAKKLGWTHHIPRLMVLGNLMTLCEIHPHNAHQWFMEMYVDSSEWVMGPNVYGMGLFSDGGIFATKPYICGSNYLLKMSDYKKGPWCDVVDGLYWRFIDRHRDFFSSNHRLSLMPKAFDRLKQERKDIILPVAEQFIQTVTESV